MEVCKTIVARCTKDPKRRRKDGRLAGNVYFYALRKDGKFAGGSIYPGARMAVHDGDSARIVPCDPLIDRAREAGG
jgi:N4-(beta-N-acetylglucosaminyl)-L-asparaginase